MGIVVDIPEAGLDYVLYGNKNNILTSYLHNQIQQLPSSFNEFSNRIYNNLTQAYNFVNDRLLQYQIYNSLKSSNMVIVNNSLVEILSFTELQNANLTMQRWVMAHPEVRQMYVNNNVDGYSDTYKNVHGSSVESNHYDYRRVMTDVLRDSDGEYSWSFTHYDDVLEIGDRELEHFEKVQIINTWQGIDWLLSTCKFDFTCKSEELVPINK